MKLVKQEFLNTKRYVVISVGGFIQLNDEFDENHYEAAKFTEIIVENMSLITTIVEDGNTTCLVFACAVQIPLENKEDENGGSKQV